MNSIMIINPYMYGGHWVFDDPDVDLVREPFVMGIDEMITEIVSEFDKPEEGFVILFSGKPFPGYTMSLERMYEEHDGNWYKSKELGANGWLCPALFKYFDTAPDNIYVQIKKGA